MLKAQFTYSRALAYDARPPVSRTEEDSMLYKRALIASALVALKREGLDAAAISRAVRDDAGWPKYLSSTPTFISTT